MRKSTLARADILVLALAGCAGPQIAPPTVPTTAEITARAQELTASGLDPATYAAVGYLLNAENCHSYFAALGQRAAQLGLAAQETTLAGGAASGIMGASGAPASGLAITSILSALGSTTLDNVANAPIPYPVETAALVRQALTSYIASAPPPSSLPSAALLVEGEAWLCSLPGAQWLAQQAVSTAQTTASAPAPVAAGMMRPAAVAPVIAVPPTISVRH